MEQTAQRSPIDPRFQQMLSILHAGGNYAYWWNRDPRTGEKLTEWWAVGQPTNPTNGIVDAYFGVHPTAKIPDTRINRKGETYTPRPEKVRAEIEEIAAVNALFAEYDAKHYTSKADALAAVQALKPAPSVIIDSGGGYHLYWLLDATWQLQTNEDRQCAADVQGRWVAFVGGDTGAKDLARVLRVPGTHNLKYEDKPTVSFIKAAFNEVYSLDYLISLLPEQEAERPAQRAIAPAVRNDDKRKRAYVEKAFREELANVLLAQDGHKHKELFAAAAAIGNLIPHGLDENVAAEKLYDAIASRAQDKKGAWDTILDGLRDGKATPRQDKDMPDFSPKVPAFNADGMPLCADCNGVMFHAKTKDVWGCKTCLDAKVEYPFWWEGNGYEPRPIAAARPDVDTATGEIQGTQRVEVRKWLEEDEIELLAPPTFLIKDILVDSEVTVIYGPGDTGKTFLVMDMVLRVAQYAPVMYVAGEDAPGIRLRKTAWQKFFKRQPNGNFRMYPDAIPFSDASRVDDFIAINKRLKTKMIVVDTLSQNAGDADENDATAMRDLFRNCMRVAHECHAAVVIIHHTDKIGNTYRGSSTIKDNTYGFFKVEKEEDDIVLDKVRVKNTQPWDYKRRYRLVSVPVELTVNNKVETLSSAIVAPAPMVTKSDKLSQNQMKILEAVGYIAKGEGYAKTSDLMMNTDLRGNNFYKPFNRLLDKGYITRYEGRGNAKGVVLDDKGRAALLQALRDGSASHDDEATYEVPLFEVNTELFSTDSTAVNHATYEVNHAGEDVNHARLTNHPKLTAYDELTEGLRGVDAYNGFRDMDGFDMPQNDSQPSTVDNELTTVEVNLSTPPHTPVGGVEGGVNTVELNGEHPAEPQKPSIDWAYLAGRYISNDLTGIKRHCVMRRLNYDDVIAALAQKCDSADDEGE